MMTHEETQALGRVIDHYIHAECEHAGGSGDTSGGHIAHSLMTLDKLRQRLTDELIDAAPPVEEVASIPDEDDYGFGPSGGETISTDRRIIFALLPLAKLPKTVEDLVTAAVCKDGLELCPAAVAAVDRIADLRDPDRVIPY